MSEMMTRELMDQYVTPNYGRFAVEFVSGQGSWLQDAEGNDYLDFATGIAVCSLGHCHQVIQDALKQQGGKLIHCSNLYQIREQALLAQHLVEQVMETAGKVFFCNSGAEANDTLIKLARKYGNDLSQELGRYEIVTCEGSFHGRTLGGIAATGQDKVKAGFEPMLPGFKHVPYNDGEALEAAISDHTVAILIEVVQGEGGIHVASEGFLQTALRLRDQHDLLLMFDEVQCGLGRTGKQRTWDAVIADLQPDAVSWAKGLAGGFPMGAVWVRAGRITTGEDGHKGQLCDALGPGSHGSTFGGTPLGSAVALAVLQEIQKDRLWENAAQLGQHIKQVVTSWGSPWLLEVRGSGLMLGFVLNVTKMEENVTFKESGQTPALWVVNRLMAAGLLTVPAGAEVVRFLPALNVSLEEVDLALNKLKQVLDGLSV
ncbi:MAG: aspartate aminotransferase family protein [Verrucomicrobiales bacterium]|nr:aspartate aminotransferase family protein [Verrucomicrobiales bacterium]